MYKILIMPKEKNNNGISSEKPNEHFELSDEYKAMMDDMLDRHEKGEVNYTAWEKIRSNFK
jgi:hypothetical protein